MRCRDLLLLLALAVAPLSAAWADNTTLSLSETATVMAPPDELAATLRAEAVASTAAGAQKQVNAAMDDALTQARAAAGVVAGTGDYGVSRDTGAKPERWQASQTLSLHGKDGAVLLALVGALQAKGLAIGDLHWQLSDETARKAQAEAMRRAISALRARAEEAAGLLDLRFVQFVSVRLDTPPAVRPMVRSMAAAAPAAATPPSAVAEDVPVSATVGAEVVLGPR